MEYFFGSHMYIKKLQQKFKNKLVLLYLQDRLTSLHISIRPFYLVKEGPFYSDKNIIKPRIEECSTGFLTDEELLGLCKHPESELSLEKLHKRIRENSRCFAVKHNGEIAGYMWFNLFCCESSYLSFALHPDEAYLFDAKIFNAFRGKNLAPFLRDQIYSHLNNQGKTKYLSITDAFNTPAKRFKLKLGAKNQKLYLQIKLFGLNKITILLKKYKLND
jgi:hypothetical protein